MRLNNQLSLPVLIISVIFIILFISAIVIIYALITKRRITKMFKDVAKRQSKANGQPQEDDEDGRVIDHEKL